MDCCELLIANGHGHFNPYEYSIKKLLHLTSVHKARIREQMVTKIVADHMSRIAIATGDGKDFKALIDQLSQSQ